MVEYISTNIISKLSWDCKHYLQKISLFYRDFLDFSPSYHANKIVGRKTTRELEIKNKLAVENFSGCTVNAIKQDFYITMFMTNIIAIACWEAQVEVDKDREDKDNKYQYHVNVNHAIGTFKDRFILALLEPNPEERDKKVEQILLLLTEHVVPKRPGRSKPRNPSPRKAKFRHNRKLNC